MVSCWRCKTAKATRLRAPTRWNVASRRRVDAGAMKGHGGKLLNGGSLLKLLGERLRSVVGAGAKGKRGRETWGHHTMKKDGP